MYRTFAPRIHRRHLLQVGSLGLMGLGLPRLLRAEAHPAARPRADHCIILFLNGGPSHLDMWDMKPAAPEGIRGEFKPIDSSLAGVPVCELLPRLATHMHRACLIRSMRHSVNNAHALAVYTAMTGHDKGDANRIVAAGEEDHPSPGAVLGHFRPPQPAVPAYVCLPYMTKEGANGPPQPGFFGGLLGRAYDPLWVLKDPNAADFQVRELTLQTDVTAQRLAQRQSLLETFDRSCASSGILRGFEVMDRFQRRAVDLLLSDATQRAFRLSDEPDTVRQRYGRNIYGQSVLLARRLIEAGTRLVTLSWAPDANATWDTHGQNFAKLRNPLLPQFDAACASLVEDLDQRGLLERTVIAVLGDFGRTPKVNGNAGRDHWNYCYSVMFLGGGFCPGLVWGASDKIGAFPARDPLSPADVIATLYEALGVPPHAELHDRLQRPHLLNPGRRVVRELLT